MTTKPHKDLTGVDLHEPKGISGATSGQVYEADGAGSGVWTSLVIPTGLFTTTFATFTASGTWTKPAKLFKARIHTVGSGGGCGAGPSTTGGTVSFGSHCSATGGTSGSSGGGGSSGSGGSGSSGNINITGSTGQHCTNSAADSVQIAGGRSGGPWGTYGEGLSDSGAGVLGSGGGGGYSMMELAAASLGATESVTFSSTAGANNGFCVIEQYISI